MAPFAGKRKRVQAEHPASSNGATSNKQSKQSKQSKQPRADSISVQIVTGDYERVLHGLVATVPPAPLDKQDITWSETFLFSAHTASIRCLAISPVTDNGKRYLATGSADERINVYSISNAPPSQSTVASKPNLNGAAIAENVINRSLGSLNNHDRAITRLHFPTKGKLFSSAEDNTVAISRSRDWTMLSSIKAPIPKVQGRPSGDTAAPGEVPTGVNDFAIHPSQKLMLSVCRGERCLRLWNLMTGKKAGVLNFDRELLSAAGETKFSSGEGRRVLWDETGEHYIVGFERGALLFGIDSKPCAIIKPPTPTKFHQYRVLSVQVDTKELELLAVSTEDGRVLLYNLKPSDTPVQGKLPNLQCVAQIGGRQEGVPSRIKDFEMLILPSGKDIKSRILTVGACSDGTVCLWLVETDELKPPTHSTPATIGRVIGRHKTESRITCLGAFVMDGERDYTQAEAVESPVEEEESLDED